ncbi:MAG: flagellar hook-basal body complex protein FliE [Candidatus Gastranaerophilaceae bacterium]
MDSFYPHYDLAGRIQHTKLDTGLGGLMPSGRMDRVETADAPDFKQVMSGLAENLNNELNAPDNLLKDVMSGSQNVDIHDVMTAMAKSEISINMATQFTGKVIQAYDKVMQIQV